MVVLENCYCGECGTPIRTDEPCAGCGSRVRCFHKTVDVEVKSQVSVRLLQQRPGAKKPLVDMFSGRDFRRRVGDFINKVRIIDRVKKVYVEHLSTDDGETLKDVVEPLEAHFGRGSNKPELRVMRAAKDLKTSVTKPKDD